ncbi:MAG: hypothetical protein A2X86_01940 [Bdellovibrionales bacterium GWA2_49_15]|nr:MAG: hypothetical protein A2X86_01940 [Bdellovibrionales bacterium GWA2_49_15]
METQTAIDIEIAPTPNPNALKFILGRPVKKEGNSTYRSPMECGDNQLARQLFAIRGVDQIHFFDNTITITKFSYADWETIEGHATLTIKALIENHNPDYFDPDPEADRRKNLSPELQKIEEILDRTIRPGLQGDGGDIQTLSLDGNVLLVRYAGACGTCPSSTTGTLEAIRAILKEEFNPEIDVYIAPEF